MAVLANGDIIVAGERREAASVLDGSDFFIAKTDESGSILWQQEYNKPGYQVAHNFLSCP
ncbi:MAG: hypothetical protein ABMA02_10620 [Saprospiraceae bacterium]